MSGDRLRDRLLERAQRAGFTLIGQALDQLETYFALLARWNKRINLTAFSLDTPTDQAIDRLLVEPLVAANHVQDAAANWYDIGSGGGSPAIPMRVLLPSTKLTLVETRSRKAAFLREAAREIKMPDVIVIGDRFETVANRLDLSGSAALITARAVRTDAAFFSSVGSLANSGAQLMLFATKGSAPSQCELFSFSRAVGLIPGSEAELMLYTRR